MKQTEKLSKSFKSEKTETTEKSEGGPMAMIELSGAAKADMVFPEWSDHSLNKEKWDDGKNKARAKSPSKEMDGADHFYRDPHEIKLPASLRDQVVSWKRINKLFPNMNVSLFKEGPISSYPDFLSGSSHILHSEFMRDFVSSIGILEYLGYKAPWPQETPSATFTPTTDEPWKPWHHIYSCCKAGKGQTHKPRVNPYGKYIVRLFWMGCWRKITIDDHLPVDSSNCVLLPVLFESHAETQLNDIFVKPKTITLIEIWPLILAKALLKLACLTWSNEEEELVDFSIITSLTGWALQEVPTKFLTPEDLWNVVVNYTENYSWNKNNPEKQPNIAQKFCLLATLRDLRYLSYKAVPGVSPCVSHDFLIEETRDIPFEKPEEMASWKKYRYLDWGRKHGFIIITEPPKSFKIVSTFRNTEWTNYVAQEFENTSEAPRISFKLDNNDSLRDEDDTTTSDIIMLESRTDAKVHKKTKGAKATTNSTKSSKTIKDSKTTTTKGKTSAPKVVPVPPPHDPSIWYDFDDVKDYLTTLKIYVRPSQFPSHIRVSDLPQVGKPVKPKAGHDIKKIFRGKDLRPTYNEPLYIFVDSLDQNTMFFHLTHCGNKEILTGDGGSNEVPLATMVLEAYNWQDGGVSDNSVALSTVGSKSFMIRYSPKRMLMRLWLKTGTSYVLDVFSNAEVLAGSKNEIFAKMSGESKVFLAACGVIRSAFGELVEAFGTPDYLTNLREFYRSIKPVAEISSFDESVINEEFCRAIYKALMDKYKSRAEDFFAAIQILLLKTRTYSFKPNNSSQDFYDKEDEACVKIQSFFKMLLVKKMVGYHNPGNKNHEGIAEKLRLINRDVFNPQFVTEIMRNLLIDCKAMEDIKKSYEFFEDIQNVINYQTIAGTADNKAVGWVPLMSCKFYPQNKSDVIKIDLLCETNHYVLRIIDNDTLEEIRRVTNNTNVTTYTANVKGYTIIGYAYVEVAKSVPWKLSFSTLKKNSFTLKLEKSASFEHKLLSDFYKPSRSQLICKARIFANQDTEFILRLTCSSNSVKFRLVYCDNEGNELGSLVARGGKGILPIVPFKYTSLETPSQIYHQDTRSSIRMKGRSVSRQSNTSTFDLESLELNDNFYIVEAYVLDGSWPINDDELRVVSTLAERNMVYLDVLGITPDYRAFTNKPERAQDPHKYSHVSYPHWCLEIAFFKNEPMVLALDQRRDIQIKSVKMVLFENDPERYLTGCLARNEFIENNILTIDSLRNLNELAFRGLSEIKILLPLEFDWFTKEGRELHDKVVKIFEKNKEIEVNELRKSCDEDFESFKNDLPQRVADSHRMIVGFENKHLAHSIEDLKWAISFQRARKQILYGPGMYWDDECANGNPVKKSKASKKADKIEKVKKKR